MSRVILLSLVWWAFTEGDVSGIGFGLVIATIVAVISVRLFPPGPHQLRPLPCMLFMAFFVARSVVAGIDVARRLLSPSLPVNPGYITITLSLPDGGPRLLLANVLSLMPGTLSVTLDGTHLTLHCLDINMPVASDVRAVEQRIARVFGLPSPHGTHHTEGPE